jgi:hypothetical protein
MRNCHVWIWNASYIDGIAFTSAFAKIEKAINVDMRQATRLILHAIAELRN